MGSIQRYSYYDKYFTLIFRESDIRIPATIMSGQMSESVETKSETNLLLSQCYQGLVQLEPPELVRLPSSPRPYRVWFYAAPSEQQHSHCYLLE